MRSLAPQKLQPAELLRQMNQLIGERRVEGRFMTACFGTWQKGCRKFRVANAGQSQPFFTKMAVAAKSNSPDSRSVSLKRPATTTGALLDPGDIVIFHSDGIAETMNSAKANSFGTERLKNWSKRITSSPPPPKFPISSFAKWIGSRKGPLSDDRTLVVLKVR
jgi:sigma-B regulation protein RsbU (phosphoserine phosphatase)